MSRAIVLTGFGDPDQVLAADSVSVADPGAGQVRITTQYAGVGPTDLAIRSGRLRGVFPDTPGTVLGFEASGVVDAVGSAVTDVVPGDRVAVFLPGLGGYAEQVVADHWVRIPSTVDPAAAAALPASGEAAVRVLDQVAAAAGESLLVVGGAGSVGRIAVQLAVARGVQVLAAVRPSDFALVETWGATPVAYGPGLVDAVRTTVGSVDALVDAARSTDLPAAITVVRDPSRIITLTDHRAGELGVRLSGPDTPTIQRSLATAMTALADGLLDLQPRTVLPLAEAARAHRALEQGARTKYLLAL